jgi:hypothetical protein
MTPTVVNTGAVASPAAGAAVTPAFGTGWTANDVMIGLGETIGNQPFTVPTGWAHVTGSPNNLDTTTQGTTLWKRFVGGDTALSWGSPADHGVARLIAIRGCKTTGNPWNATPVTSQDSVASATATWPAVTTTVADCLILFIIMTGRDANATTNLGALTGGTGLTNPVEQMDNWVLTGGGGGIGLITATKATAGSTGSPTATMGSTDSKVLMTLALEPAPVETLWRRTQHPSYRR